MRTLSFRSNVLFIVAAAVGLVAALGRPWYAQGPAVDPTVYDGNGPVEDLAMRLGREISTTGGTTGWDAFTSIDTILSALVVVAVISALATLAPAIERPAREVLRVVALAMLGIVVVKIADTPDAVGLVERRQGAWIALGATGVMAASATTLCSAPLTRRDRGGPSLTDYNPNLVAPPRSHAFDTPPLER